MTDKPEDDQQTTLTRYITLAAGAVATGLLTDLTSQLLGESYGKSGVVQWVGFGVTFLLLVVLALQLVSRYRRSRRRGQQTATELHAAAEEAEQWLVALGSETGGTGAAEWFELSKDWLHELLKTEKPTSETLDDFARICDALEAWHVRRPDPEALLELSDLLSAAAEACGDRGLAELAAARAATAHRMLGDLDTASTKLGVSDNIAANGRTAAALKMRRQVERALLHLAVAGRAPAGSDRDEAVLNARDRLDDARLLRPGPDLAADVAISINLAVVHLYQHDAEGALEHLRPAQARAKAAGDVSGEAHTLELIGVAAWMQRNPREAVKRWTSAAERYSEIDENEGRARCLQHLGSAQVAAGELDDAVKLLEESERLRTTKSEILTQYLDAARKTSDPPVVADDPTRPTPLTWLKLAFRRFVGGLE